MNLQEANLAYETYMTQLITTTQHGTRDDVVQLVMSGYPREAVDFLTQTGAPILVIYYALVAFALYKLIGRMRYLYRFLISLVVFFFCCLRRLHIGRAKCARARVRFRARFQGRKHRRGDRLFVRLFLQEARKNGTAPTRNSKSFLIAGRNETPPSFHPRESLLNWL